ncbi:MAG TPA: type IV secretion system DNA-binding domain-containing protein [Thermoanaerobaculia bacterium]|jgi:DNA helicase HerA-like ATPase|nr:type IV secretion system DNA-binding domain-containing protein [Thermoanaerobaculia bacterium]
MKDITYFARTNFRGGRKLFGIRRAESPLSYICHRQTGAGKSTLFETLMRQDLENGEGFALLDPHGDLFEKVRTAVPEARREAVIAWNVPDSSSPIRFNPLSGVEPQKRSLAVAGLIAAFERQWHDSLGVRMEHVLRNTLFALLEAGRATLADIPRLLEVESFRREVIARVANKQARAFFEREYESFAPSMRAQVIGPILNKVGAFLSDPTLCRILVSSESSFDFRRLMDSGGVLLVNLSKGKIGEGPASLLGALLVASIGLSELSRADLPADGRRPFFVYLEEFQSFATLSLAGMLSELRKYGVGLVLANQYLASSRLRSGMLSWGTSAP